MLVAAGLAVSDVPIWIADASRRHDRPIKAVRSRSKLSLCSARPRLRPFPSLRCDPTAYSSWRPRRGPGLRFDSAAHYRQPSRPIYLFIGLSRSCRIVSDVPIWIADSVRDLARRAWITLELHTSRAFFFLLSIWAGLGSAKQCTHPIAFLFYR